jgi:hypothetical protein
MKRLREEEEENDEWGEYNPHKLWENGNEEEEEEEEELPFPPHPCMCCGITWENIEESLRQGILPSTLYKELPRDTDFTFKLRSLEGHGRYLKNKLHLSSKEIEESDEMLESFVPLEDIIEYCFN